MATTPPPPPHPTSTPRSVSPVPTPTEPPHPTLQIPEGYVLIQQSELDRLRSAATPVLGITPPRPSGPVIVTVQRSIVLGDTNTAMSMNDYVELHQDGSLLIRGKKYTSSVSFATLLEKQIVGSPRHSPNFTPFFSYDLPDEDRICEILGIRRRPATKPLPAPTTSAAPKPSDDVPVPTADPKAKEKAFLGESSTFVKSVSSDTVAVPVAGTAQKQVTRTVETGIKLGPTQTVIGPSSRSEDGR